MTATVFGRIRRNQQSLELQVLYLSARTDRDAVARLPQPLRLPEWPQPKRIWQGALQGACPHKNKSIACCVMTISLQPKQRVCFSVRQPMLRVLHAESSLDCSGSEQSAQKPAATPFGICYRGQLDRRNEGRADPERQIVLVGHDSGDHLENIGRAEGFCEDSNDTKSPCLGEGLRRPLTRD